MILFALLGIAGFLWWHERAIHPKAAPPSPPAPGAPAPVIPGVNAPIPPAGDMTPVLPPGQFVPAAAVFGVVNLGARGSFVALNSAARAALLQLMAARAWVVTSFPQLPSNNAAVTGRATIADPTLALGLPNPIGSSALALLRASSPALDIWIDTTALTGADALVLLQLPTQLPHTTDSNGVVLAPPLAKDPNDALFGGERMVLFSQAGETF